MFLFVVIALLTVSQLKGDTSKRLTLDYTIVEEAQNRLEMGRVGEDAHLKHKYDQDKYRSLRYTFLRQEPRIIKLFDINSSNDIYSLSFKHNISISLLEK